MWIHVFIENGQDQVFISIFYRSYMSINLLLKVSNTSTSNNVSLASHDNHLDFSHKNF